MKITGRIVGGKFVGDSPASWSIAARECEGKNVTLDLEPRKETRSLRANARHWAVIVPLAQHALNLKRGDAPPLSREQVHYVLVTAFGASEETELGPVPVRSSQMTKQQFHQLDEKAARWLMDLGYGIPEGQGAEQMVEEAMA